MARINMAQSVLQYNKGSASSDLRLCVMKLYRVTRLKSLDSSLLLIHQQLLHSVDSPPAVWHKHPRGGTHHSLVGSLRPFSTHSSASWPWPACSRIRELDRVLCYHVVLVQNKIKTSRGCWPSSAFSSTGL